MNVIERIEELKVIPVAAIENAKDAIPLANSLIEGGLPIIEITFRTAAATDAISQITKEFPELLVGSGTVLTIDQVKSSIESGAKFIVTPGYNPTIVDYCVENDITISPGLNSPSFVEWGLEKGLKCFKFFPAEVSGGIKMLQAFAGPYQGIKFIPTGGISDKNLLDYLSLPNVIACGGSWLVKKDLISAKNFEEIKKRVEDAVSLTKKAN